MKHGYSNKKLHGEDAKAPRPKELICVRECVAPGYGSWKSGEIITAPELVERFAGNPNFEIKEG